VNFFFQSLNDDTHLGTLNTKPFIFTHRWMEVIKKISSFPPPVNLLTAFGKPLFFRDEDQATYVHSFFRPLRS
jgi:hypothetical protein